MERVLLAALGFLLLVPTVSALEYSGSIGVMSCTNGWTDLNILLEEPAGGFVPLEGFEKSLSVSVKDTIPGAGVYSYTYSYKGILDEEGLAPGKYRIVAAAPFTCYNMYGVPYDHRGTAVAYEEFQVNASSPLPDNWNWSTGCSEGWNSKGFDDSGWSADTPASWKGLYWHCSSKDWYGRCQSWEVKGSENACFRKTFQLEGLAQMDLIVDASQKAECWVNGQGLGEVEGRADITGFLESGENLVACRATSGFEKREENLHDYWSFSVPGMGCTIHCQAADCTSFTCGDPNTKCVKSSINGFWRWSCYRTAEGKFDGIVALHKEKDILWSNDNRTWYYTELPLGEGSWYLEKPDYYNPDGTVYTGIMPWSGEGLFLRKWIFPKRPSGTILVSSTTEPLCTLNGMVLAFQETVDDWWVYKSEVSGLKVGKQSLLLCYSPKSEYYSLFDMEFREVSFAAPSSSPFEPASGEGGGGASGEPEGSVPVPLIPVAGSVFAVGAIGAVGIIRRPSAKNSSFWKRIGDKRSAYQSRLERIEEENRKWREWQEYTRKWYRERSISLEQAKVYAFLSGLTGTFSERLERLKEWRAKQRINFRGTEDLLNRTAAYYTLLAGAEKKADNQKSGGLDGEGNIFKDSRIEDGAELERINQALDAFRNIDMGKFLLAAITPEVFIRAWEEWVEYIRYNNSLAEGDRYKDSPKAQWGIIFSSAGSAVMEISETLGIAASALMWIGTGIALKFPAAAGLSLLGSRLNQACMVSYTLAAVLKSIGDSLQGWACSEKGDSICVENAGRKMQWNLINGLTNIVTAGAPKVIKYLYPDFIKKIESFIKSLTKVKNPGDGLGDNILEGFMEAVNGVIMEPFDGFNIKTGYDFPDNKY